MTGAVQDESQLQEDASKLGARSAGFSVFVHLWCGWLLVGWLVGWLVGCLVFCFFGCLVVWLFGCLVGWLVGWLVGCLVV